MTGVEQLAVPANLMVAAVQQRREGWLATLPQMVSELKSRWSLKVGEPFQPGGQTAWVAPARTETNRDLVLKLEWRHFEAEHETDGLRMWNGGGAVRLHLSRHFDGSPCCSSVASRGEPGFEAAS
jgi:streptomycin 6-kinase